MFFEWRVLLSGAGNGAYNMAVDEALLNGVIAETSPPTLRFYTWRHDCLSFGFLQKVDGQIRNNCENYDVEMVRRPTGGYAVLHGWDLCYSVVAPLATPLDISPYGAAHIVGSALATGLCCLGAPVELALFEEREQLATEEISCAAAISLNEIILAGKKIAGSASLRRKGCYLQQGSIFVDFNRRRIAELFSGYDEGCDTNYNRSAGLRQVWDGKFSLTELIRALRNGFKEQLKVRLVPKDLDYAEESATKKLMQGKYATLDYRRQRGRI